MMKRIQRKRTKGWRMPPNTRYVGRGTKWENCYRIAHEYDDLEKEHSWWIITEDGLPVSDEYDTEIEAYIELVDLYRDGVVSPAMRVDPHWLDELRGYDALACWCPLDQPCHADVLIELLENTTNRVTFNAKPLYETMEGTLP